MFVSPYAFEPHYNGTEKYIGLDGNLRSHARVVKTGDMYPICPGITLQHCWTEKQYRDIDASGLKVQEKEGFLTEDFRHEQYLLVEEHGKRVLFSGCSHKGIFNVVHWFQPDVLVGGFHLSKMPIDSVLEGYARELAQCPTVFYTCHCTGTTQFDYMKRFMPNLSYLSTGDWLEIS